MLGGEQRAKGGVSDTVVSARVNLIPRVDFFFFPFFDKLTQGCLTTRVLFSFLFFTLFGFYTDISVSCQF